MVEGLGKTVSLFLVEKFYFLKKTPADGWWKLVSYYEKGAAILAKLREAECQKQRYAPTPSQRTERGIARADEALAMTSLGYT